MDDVVECDKEPRERSADVASTSRPTATGVLTWWRQCAPVEDEDAHRGLSLRTMGIFGEIGDTTLA